MKCEPSSLGSRLHLHVGRVGTGFFFRQRESGQLFAVHKPRQPLLFLLARSEKQQRANADGMMRVGENGSGSVARADFLQHLAIRHLRKSAAAKFLRRGHSQNADAAESVDYRPWNISFPIDRRRIQIFIEKLPHFDAATDRVQPVARPESADRASPSRR